MKKQSVLRILTVLLALCLIGGGIPIPAGAVTQAQIDALKQEAKELNQQKQAIQSKIDALSADIGSNLEKKTLLDQQISITESDIANKEAEIAGYADMITQTEEELADAEEREEKQYALFCKRVRAMEEHGTEEYWAVLFRADSFSDLLGRLDIVNEIMDFDQRVIRDLKEIQAEITETKAQLEEQKAASESAKAQLVSKKTDLDNQRDAANALIAQLRAQQAEQEDAYDDLDAEADAVQARAQQLSRQLAAEQAEAERKRREAEAAAHAAAAANGQNANTTTSVPASSGASNPGGYIWPVNSHYVTSTVGGRASPGGIGSTNHKGTDIGRVGYTSSVYAAKSGTVIISEYSRSYGNYIVISHGSGNTTLYAHMSKLIAKEGQQVSQGQVIGVTGSTGNSTGPHLHFEVSEGGVRIDPLKKGYLTGATIRNK